MFTIFVPTKTAPEIARIICDPSLNSNPLELTALNIDLAAYDLDLSPGKVVIRQKIFSEQVTSQEYDKPVIPDENKAVMNPGGSSSQEDDTMSVTSEFSTFDESTLTDAASYENKEPIKVTSLDELKKLDFTNSNIVYTNINGKIINKANYSSIIRELYSIIHVPEQIIKESTLKLHEGIKKDCGYRYYEEMKLSLPHVPF